ncbi:MAG: DUF1460 domain-containing protein [Firmicutes bacterium]|nr:DUF1460 domain-containing protein [Bacillota bacterium]MCM1477570.1 DUF1460 domain-containing protein [Bacteroides sp.]
MRKFVTVATVAVCGVFEAMGITPAEVRFHNEAADTTKLTDILIEIEAMNLESPEAIVAEAGSRFLGVPYVAGTLEGEPEQLTVNTSELDCTTFVETALALAMTVESRRTSWRDYINNLEQLRYRGGRVNGYPSRLHYVSDWIVDNAHRGNLVEVTDRVGQTDSKIKTLDYMTQHRDAYPALADSANYAGLKNVEVGFRSHKYSYIRPASLPSARLKDGDVIALTTNMAGLDVTHLGIVKMVKGVPHLMHASLKQKKVVIDELSLADYLRRHRPQGFRVIRLAY